jgi:hypothetical protein
MQAIFHSFFENAASAAVGVPGHKFRFSIQYETG